jgi:hypothetical protein
VENTEKKVEEKWNTVNRLNICAVRVPEGDETEWGSGGLLFVLSTSQI